jgi:hypothetical protein
MAVKKTNQFYALLQFLQQAVNSFFWQWNGLSQESKDNSLFQFYFKFQRQNTSSVNFMIQRKLIFSKKTEVQIFLFGEHLIRLKTTSKLHEVIFFQF